MVTLSNIWRRIQVLSNLIPDLMTWIWYHPTLLNRKKMSFHSVWQKFNLLRLVSSLFPPLMALPFQYVKWWWTKKETSLKKKFWACNFASTPKTLRYTILQFITSKLFEVYSKISILRNLIIDKISWSIVPKTLQGLQKSRSVALIWTDLCKRALMHFLWITQFFKKCTLVLECF